MSIKKDTFFLIVSEFFPNSEINIVDLVGDENHYQVSIISHEFANLTKIQQHRLVNQKLKDYIGNDMHKVHAVSFVTADKK